MLLQNYFKMKKFIITASIALVGWAINAQATFKVGAGAHLVLGDATVVADSSHIVLEGQLDAGTSTFKLSGLKNVNLQSGGNQFYQFVLDKTTGAVVLLLDSLAIANSFIFSNSKIVLGSHNVLFSNTANVTGFGDNAYFVTGSTGQVRKAGLGSSPFTFPVGFNLTTYNPITVTENGTADTIGILCMEHAMRQGCLGAPITAGVVDASWEVTEAIPGGMNLDVVVQWNQSDELGGFDRMFSGNSHYGANGWDLSVDDCAAATGSDPFTQERLGITSSGAMAVGNDSLATEVKIDLDLFLSGPYAGSSLMDDDLRAGGHLPTDEPFGGLGFTHHGFGGGESAVSTVFDVTGNEAIVDWVLVEVRNGNDSADIKATVPAFLRRDGSIVNLDGASSLSLPGIDEGNYFMVVKHRNHLGVMSANKIALSGTPVAYSFTTDPTKSFGGLNALEDFGDGNYGLIGGDFNHNGQVQNTDVTGLLPNLGNSGYLQGDLDMNSQTQNTDLQLMLLPNIGRGVQYPNN